MTEKHDKTQKNIPVDETDAAQVHEVLQLMQSQEQQLARLRMNYRAQEDALIARHAQAQTDIQGLVKLVGARSKAPEGWLLNIDLMRFEPPKNPKG